MFTSRHFLSIFALFFSLFFTGCKRDIKSSVATSILRISTENDPSTLDPRLARELSAATYLHMLYEGLTRLNEEGTPLLALAESVNITNDQTTYTFTLKPSVWSNGSPVTARDFEETWKSMLDPKFPAPNAYQLYVIKGAKAAKEGTKPLDQVGIKAMDDKTLIVQLEHPTPYFLNLTATFFYYPVSAELRAKNIHTEAISDQYFVTNGPFQLKEWKHNNELTAVRNPYYRDKHTVFLDAVSFLTLDNATALSMFDRQELDWTGSPLSTIPTDALETLKLENKLNINPAAAVFMVRFNTEKPPFNNQEIRKAFSLALNRKELVTYVLQGNQTPAKGFIPPPFINRTALYRDHHLTKAQELLKSALEELSIKKEELPPITLYYAMNERAHKIAQVAQQQWKEAFEINISIQSYENKVFFDILKNHDYQAAIGAWFADICDPISFLNVFKYKNNGTNNTGWECPHYVQLLNLSSQTDDPNEREEFLAEAERVLIEEMPIAPLFYGSYNFVKNPRLKNVYFSELGYLDFKKAYMEN